MHYSRHIILSHLSKLFLIIMGVLSASTQAITPTTPPQIIPQPPSVRARAFILMDATTGTVIAEKNAHKKIPPASLTKLMTLYLIENALNNKHINLDDKAHISRKAWKMKGSRMFVKVDTSVPVQQLIQGIIVASGNDACVAMAEYLAGNETSFAASMNQAAHFLGMQNSHFVDSTGLPSANHYSTPYDIALLSKAIIHDFPQYYHFFNQKWFKYNKIKQANRNRLLWRDPAVDGLKTGHTQSAGYCLVSSKANSAMRLISVVMGEPSDQARTQDSQALLNYGTRFYETRTIFSPKQELQTQRVYLGKQKYIKAGPQNSVAVLTPRYQHPNITSHIQFNSKNLRAPIKINQQIGSITVQVHGKVVQKIPLVALQPVEAGGLWSKVRDNFLLFMHKFI